MEKQLKAEFGDLSLPKYSYVCSLHFKADCFHFAGLCKNLKLKKGSYPSIFSSLEHDELEKQFVEADTSLNDSNSPLVEAIDSEHITVGINKATNNSLSNSEAELTEESPFMHVPEFSAAEPSIKEVSKRNNETTKLSSKSMINIDVESLDMTKDVKDILRNGKAQIMTLRQKNKPY